MKIGKLQALKGLMGLEEIFVCWEMSGSSYLYFLWADLHTCISQVQAR